MLPILVLAGSSLAAWAVFALRESPKPQVAVAEIPEVKIVRVAPQTLRLNVDSQGIVSPRDEIDLVNEVAGKVVQMHPALAAGGFFKAHELLLTIDPRDYDYAVIAAQARIAEAKRVLIAEQAQVAQALNEWQALGEGEASDLALRKPQLAEAQAKLSAAQADLAQAQLNRSRCELHAPFAGRVLSKHAGLGQYLPAGAISARIYASAVAEIRLPVSQEELAFLNLPLALPHAAENLWPEVTLTAELGGHRHQWRGHIVRTEAAVSADSGQWYLVAQVADPWQPVANRPPLIKGLFVQAEIQGAERADVYRLPRAAVSPMQSVKLVNADQQLEIRPIEILRLEADAVIIKAGLHLGDRVVVSELPIAIAGTKVRVSND
jgi:RND family efflux transporter MFP subunit